MLLIRNSKPLKPTGCPKSSMNVTKVTIQQKLPPDLCIIKNQLKAMLKTISWTIIGLIIGAAGGFAYYYYVGCASGSCPITSNPWISTLYGSGMGALAFNSLGSKKIENKI